MLRIEHDELQAIGFRVAALEGEAAGLRCSIAERDTATARERAQAVVSGGELPKRAKQADTDRRQLEDVEAALPYAIELLNAAGLRYRNALLQRISDRHEVKGRHLSALKEDLKTRMKALTDELSEIESGPEQRCAAVLSIGDALLHAQSPTEILNISNELFAQHPDFIEDPAEPAAEKAAV